MSDSITNLIDKAILDNKLKAKRERPKIDAEEIKRLESIPIKNDDIIKKNFLIDLYGKIVTEYQKVLDVLRRRAAADKRTIMKLNNSEVKAAAKLLFGPNVKAITYERYLDLLRLEKDLNMICVQDKLEDGDILNAQ